MIDRNLLLDDFEATATQLGRKGVDRAMLEQTRDLLLRRKALVGEVDQCRAEMNRSSAEIGALYKAGRGEEAAEKKVAVSDLKQTLSGLETELADTVAQIEDTMLSLPNLPAADCPDGSGEADNVIVRYEGESVEKYEEAEYRPHWEIGKDLGILDLDRGSKISGSMFAIFRREGARLVRALAQYALDLNGDTYEEILPPHVVTTETFTGTGHLPKFEMDAYKFRDDDLWAIPTGEVPLTAMHRGEILSMSELPRRYMAYTVCFRREAGSAGQETRGLQRLHEFHKVELVRLCASEQVPSEFAALLADAERPLRELGLPYRVVELCAGDLTFSSTRIFDLEVYAPGTKRWLEVSSIGTFSDFQARRGNSRFRRAEGKKPEFLHAMNGSGIATPRVWIAVIEHGQQSDGSVKIPEPLVPYMGTSVIGPR